jgi:3-deoxy-D-manno-octulosonate 8-phosphate phosphatase (KDO 8-P phosphatase)
MNNNDNAIIESNTNKIKLLVMDVDGTLTDGKIYMGQDGEIFKAFNVKDGYAIHNILPEHDILPAIITGRISQIVENRAKELGITLVYQGIKDKLALLKEITREKNIPMYSVAFIGDDINDLECMKNCGMKACPADAVPEIKAIADFVCAKNGGDGAVREFIESIVA